MRLMSAWCCVVVVDMLTYFHRGTYLQPLAMDSVSMTFWPMKVCNVKSFWYPLPDPLSLETFCDIFRWTRTSQATGVTL